MADAVDSQTPATKRVYAGKLAQRTKQAREQKEALIEILLAVANMFLIHAEEPRHDSDGYTLAGLDEVPLLGN